jgi:hypothetical protein
MDLIRFLLRLQGYCFLEGDNPAKSLSSRGDASSIEVHAPVG